MAEAPDWAKTETPAAPPASAPGWASTAVAGPPKVSDIPGNDGKPVAAPQTPSTPTPTPSPWERVQGAAQAMYAIPRNIIPGIANELSKPIGKNGVTVEDKRPDPNAIMRKYGYTPSSPVGREYLENIGKFIDESKLAVPVTGLGAAGALKFPPIGAANAAKAIPGAAVGAVDAFVPELLKRGAAKVGGAVVPKIVPETAELAQKAQAIGIPLRPDMLSENKLLRLAGEWSENVPLAGAKHGERQVAFNKALGQLIGADEKAERITPDVFDKAMTQSGETIGKISAKYPIMVTENLIGELQKAALKQTPDVAKVVQDYIKDIADSAKAGVVPGEVFRKLRTELGTHMRSTDNGDLTRALSKLDETMLDAIKANLAPQEMAEFDLARQQYAAAKTLVPLVAKATGGNISPAGLMAQMTKNATAKENMARGRGGDMGDLAKIGQRFLKEPGTSNTAERGFVGAGLIGAGNFEPHTAAAVYGGANLYNRLGPRIAKRLTQNQIDRAKIGNNP